MWNNDKEEEEEVMQRKLNLLWENIEICIRKRYLILIDRNIMPRLSP